MVKTQRKRRQTRSARNGRGSSWSAQARAQALLARDDVPGELGTLVAHHGVAVDVRLDEPSQLLEQTPGQTPGSKRVSVKVRRRSGHVVGDRVEVMGERLRRLERSNELRRRDAMGKVHVVAANLDVLGIVLAPVPGTPGGFVDRALVSATAARITPFLLVNKSDLPGAAALVAQLRATFIDGPGGLPLPLFELSASEGSGIEPLREFFATGGAQGQRGAFVGTSGVGKSSLLNTLLPELALNVGEINEYSGLGRHTTTTATLHRLPTGGELIDTPGFRDFGLVDVSIRELTRFFPGFGELLLDKQCRFSDCSHLVEPDCVIQAAVAAGELAQSRWQRYHDLVRELQALPTRR